MSRRTSIYLDDYDHDAPIPVAARIGEFIATGNISGYDHAGAYPETAEAQARNMFGHVRAALAAAGASFDDILKMTVYVRDNAHRAGLNAVWVEAFPSPESRPARQTILHPELPPARLIACDVLAIAPQ